MGLLTTMDAAAASSSSKTFSISASHKDDIVLVLTRSSMDISCKCFLAIHIDPQFLSIVWAVSRVEGCCYARPHSDLDRLRLFAIVWYDRD